jgi:hypothetical protein
MPKDKLAALRIQVLPFDETTDQNQIDEYSRGLYQELKDSKADEVKLISTGSVQRGAKGDPAIAEIAVAFLAPFTPEIFNLIRSWVKRRPEVKVNITPKNTKKELRLTISSEQLANEDLEKIIKAVIASLK